MTDKEKKHRKGQESTIGKIIYGFLLFMPLFAIGVTCGYAMFNKNAYKSYDQNTNEYDYELITDANDISLDYQYTLQTKVPAPVNTSQYIGVNQLLTFDVISVDYGLDAFIDAKKFGMYYDYNTSNVYYYMYDANNNILLNGTNNNSLNALFKLTINNVTSNVTNNNFFEGVNLYKNQANEGSLISNVFYYSVNKVTESPLFNWVQNSIIYTTTNSTCNALSITTPFIPLLLSYWLIISVIYFLYDIALMLVWLIHHKIHELQESL